MLNLFLAETTRRPVWNGDEKLVEIRSTVRTVDNAIVPNDLSAEEITEEARRSLRRKYGRNAEVSDIVDVSALYFPRDEVTKQVAMDIRRRMNGDPDVSGYANLVTGELRHLFDACEITYGDTNPEQEPATQALAGAYTTFVISDRGDLGGSRSEYCASHVRRALEGLRLRLRDDETGHAVAHDIVRTIRLHAVNPDRELSELREAGVPVEEYAAEPPSRGAEKASEDIER